MGRARLRWRAGRLRPWRRRETPKRSASWVPRKPQGLLMLTLLARPLPWWRAEQTPEASQARQVRLSQQKRLWVPQRARRPSQQLQGLMRQRKRLGAQRRRVRLRPREPLKQGSQRQLWRRRGWRMQQLLSSAHSMLHRLRSWGRTLHTRRTL